MDSDWGEAVSRWSVIPVMMTGRYRGALYHRFPSSLHVLPGCDHFLCCWGAGWCWHSDTVCLSVTTVAAGKLDSIRPCVHVGKMFSSVRRSINHSAKWHLRIHSLSHLTFHILLMIPYYSNLTWSLGTDCTRVVLQLFEEWYVHCNLIYNHTTKIYIFLYFSLPQI